MARRAYRSRRLSVLDRTDVKAVTLLVLGGVTAAMHVGKASIALPVLLAAGSSPRLDGMTAAWLLAIPGVAGALGCTAIGASLPVVGLLRAFRLGLLTAGFASAVGAVATGADTLLVARAVESLAGVVVVVAVPVLLNRAVVPSDRSVVFGLWGAYMPVGQALVVLLGAGLVVHGGWAVLWWITSSASLVTVCLSVVALRSMGTTARTNRSGGRSSGPRAGRREWSALALLAVVFGLYTTQWMAVVGYLPTIFDDLGLVLWVAGLATAGVLLGNAVGNVGAGVVVRRHLTPLRVLLVALLVMSASGTLVFVPGMPAWVTIVTALVFSTFGGAVPGTLFGIVASMRAPGPSLRSAFLVQGSQTGTALGPLLVGTLVAVTGGWNTAALLMLGAGSLSLAVLLAWARCQRGRADLVGRHAPNRNSVSHSHFTQ